MRKHAKHRAVLSRISSGTNKQTNIQTNKNIKKQYQSNSLLMLHFNSTILETKAKKNKNISGNRLINLLCKTSKLPERIFGKRPQH
jgi:hypothetical protein